MSGLRSALEEWAGQDLTGAGVDDLADDLVELELASGLLEAERARRLTRFDEISGPRREGFPSLTAFLIHRCRIAAGRARRLVGLANTAARSPHVSEAWSSLRVSTDQAHRLLETADAEPAAFAEAEERLVRIVEPLTVSETRRALAYWSQTVSGGDGSELEEEAQRGISLSGTIGGMGRIDGWLTPTALQTLHTTSTLSCPHPHPTIIGPSGNVATTPSKTWPETS